MRTDIVINRVIVILWISCLLALGFLDLSFVAQNISVDSDTIMEFKDSDNEEAGNSFRNTALFFRMIPESLIVPFVLAVSAFSLYIFMKDLRRIDSLLIAVFITLSPMILFMTRPQKETIVLIMVICIVWATRIFKSDFVKIAIILLLYLMYAKFMRSYYMLIVAIFLFFRFHDLVVKNTKLTWGVFYFIISLPVICILTILPESFFMETQGVRDVVNMHHSRVARTSFLNPLPPENGLYFIINYIYSVLRLNLPILFTFGYKEILHMMTIFIIFYLFMIGLRSKDSNAKLFTQLGLSHIIVLMIFEPDLGSYLRHVTTIFLYFTPMLIMYDNINPKKGVNYNES